MHDKFCKDLGNVHYGAESIREQEDSVAVKTEPLFREFEQADSDWEVFAKPIRSPRDEGFFGGRGYNSHPLQKEDR